MNNQWGMNAGMGTVTIPRGIAVVDVGFTNTKVILYDGSLKQVAELKTPSPHHDGTHYREIDTAAIVDFAKDALNKLDQTLPIDVIVPSAHGACVVALKADGTPAVPVMDYTSEPPADVVAAYQSVMPGFAESYSPYLPMALLHAVQLFWQQRVMPGAFAETTTIMPLMQYVAFALGGAASTEVSSLSCQSHLVDMRSGAASTLAVSQGWSRHFATMAKAWQCVGHIRKAPAFQGEGKILSGVHDSNANYLRYLAGGLTHFTLLSTGTWIISFDTDADMTRLDHSKDIVANKDVFGRTVACSRFFGGKEFEVLAQGADGTSATIAATQALVDHGTMALPSFTDSGGPVPNTGGKGHIIGQPPSSDQSRAALASLYCALMMSESLDALHSKHTIIVDGPFSQNQVFLQILAALRPGQPVMASGLRDGTATGAACLALMPDGLLPKIDIAMRQIEPAVVTGLTAYQTDWRTKSRNET